MPPRPLIDLARVDLETTVFPIEKIRGRNAQRYEMEMLHRVAYCDVDAVEAVGIREIGEDEFWARGHFPGRPVFPGVLMIETAGQLCSFVYTEKFGTDRVMGFAAANDIKFRGQVVPGDRLVILSKGVQVRERAASFDTQCFVDGGLVFEGRIVGVPLS